jgi:hypothetical protein
MICKDWHLNTLSTCDEAILRQAPHQDQLCLDSVAFTGANPAQTLHIWSSRLSCPQRPTTLVSGRALSAPPPCASVLTSTSTHQRPRSNYESRTQYRRRTRRARRNCVAGECESSALTALIESIRHSSSRNATLILIRQHRTAQSTTFTGPARARPPIVMMAIDTRATGSSIAICQWQHGSLSRQKTLETALPCSFTTAAV